MARDRTPTFSHTYTHTVPTQKLRRFSQKLRIKATPAITKATVKENSKCDPLHAA